MIGEMLAIVKRELNVDMAICSSLRTAPSKHDTLIQCWVSVGNSGSTINPTLNQRVVFDGEFFYRVKCKDDRVKRHHTVIYDDTITIKHFEKLFQDIIISL